jgi:flavin reductase (DIM6/NTAB) family NADH-FMN oxidoreductase RutF
MESDPFDAIMTSLDAALIVVTAADGRERAGCLVGFHSQSSIEPGRYCVWLSKANFTYRVALRSTHLGIHFLAGADTDLASRFGSLTGDDVDKFAGLDVSDGPGGVPMLPACTNRVVARRTAMVDEGGDHVCFVTEPVTVHTDGPFEPLRLSRTPHVEAGHEHRERPGPSTERAASGPGTR